MVERKCMNFAEAFNRNPLIGILRGIERNQVTSVIQAVIDGGVTCVEITMNTPGAASIINLVRAYFNNKCCIGAGTVLTVSDCKDAIEAGAQYIVTPCVDKSVIDYCKSNNVPVVPGALTPTEVYAAWVAGASLVKVFPVISMGGPDYIKELRGPFTTIPLVAVSGVTIDKVDDYFRAGVNGIGLGQKLFPPELIKEKNFKKIQDIAQDYTKAIAKNRPVKEIKEKKFTDLI
jgi:2-dehydro-3-deoxyphosphogluconate aldolase/(4S)-4-hydroxy-2-oxoglutarate aldolase